MAFSAEFCRQQEALQLNIAQTDPLKNCRKIAATAAAAWSKAAAIAEKRETGPDARSKEDTAIAAEFAREEADGTAHNGPSLDE